MVLHPLSLSLFLSLSLSLSLSPLSSHPVSDGHRVEQPEHDEEGATVDEAGHQDVAYPQLTLHLW